jgi:hypothetical protein
MRTAVGWRHTGRLRFIVAICVSFEPNARKTPQPIQAPPAPGISDGTLRVKAVVHTQYVEHTTEQADSTAHASARVSEALRPVGQRPEEAINDEVAFRGVKLDVPNGSTNATKQEPSMPRVTSIFQCTGRT